MVIKVTISTYLAQFICSMNRKKKINSILKSRAKKATAKLQNSNKPKYISKAERAKLAEQEQAVVNDVPDSTD